MTHILGLCPEVIQPQQGSKSLGFIRGRETHHPRQLGLDFGKSLFIVAAIVAIIIRKETFSSERRSDLPKVTQKVSWLLETMRLEAYDPR